jgi:hypothetical protein
MIVRPVSLLIVDSMPSFRAKFGSYNASLSSTVHMFLAMFHRCADQAGDKLKSRVSWLENNMDMTKRP